MIKLFIDKKISPKIKGYILITLVYLISPLDIIPDIIPVVGLIDDLLVLSVILNKIINSADPETLEIIKTYWAGEDDVFKKVKEIVATMNEISSKIPRAIYNFIKKNE